MSQLLSPWIEKAINSFHDKNATLPKIARAQIMTFNKLPSNEKRSAKATLSDSWMCIEAKFTSEAVDNFEKATLDASEIVDYDIITGGVILLKDYNIVPFVDCEKAIWEHHLVVNKFVYVGSRLISQIGSNVVNCATHSPFQILLKKHLKLKQYAELCMTSPDHNNLDSGAQEEKCLDVIDVTNCLLARHQYVFIPEDQEKLLDDIPGWNNINIEPSISASSSSSTSCPVNAKNINHSKASTSHSTSFHDIPHNSNSSDAVCDHKSDIPLSDTHSNDLLTVAKDLIKESHQLPSFSDCYLETSSGAKTPNSVEGSSNKTRNYFNQLMFGSHLEALEYFEQESLSAQRAGIFGNIIDVIDSTVPQTSINICQNHPPLKELEFLDCQPSFAQRSRNCSSNVNAESHVSITSASHGTFDQEKDLCGVVNKTICSLIDKVIKNGKNSEGILISDSNGLKSTNTLNRTFDQEVPPTHSSMVERFADGKNSKGIIDDMKCTNTSSGILDQDENTAQINIEKSINSSLSIANLHNTSESETSLLCTQPDKRDQKDQITSTSLVTSNVHGVSCSHSEDSSLTDHRSDESYSILQEISTVDLLPGTFIPALTSTARPTVISLTKDNAVPMTSIEDEETRIPLNISKFAVVSLHNKDDIISRSNNISKETLTSDCMIHPNITIGNSTHLEKHLNTPSSENSKSTHGVQTRNISSAQNILPRPIPVDLDGSIVYDTQDDFVPQNSQDPLKLRGATLDYLETESEDPYMMTGTVCSKPNHISHLRGLSSLLTAPGEQQQARSLCDGTAEKFPSRCPGRISFVSQNVANPNTAERFEKQSESSMKQLPDHNEISFSGVHQELDHAKHDKKWSESYKKQMVDQSSNSPNYDAFIINEDIVLPSDESDDVKPSPIEEETENILKCLERKGKLSDGDIVLIVNSPENRFTSPNNASNSRNECKESTRNMKPIDEQLNKVGSEMPIHGKDLSKPSEILFACLDKDQLNTNEHLVESKETRSSSLTISNAKEVNSTYDFSITDSQLVGHVFTPKQNHFMKKRSPPLAVVKASTDPTDLPQLLTSPSSNRDSMLVKEYTRGCSSEGEWFSAEDHSTQSPMPVLTQRCNRQLHKIQQENYMEFSSEDELPSLGVDLSRVVKSLQLENSTSSSLCSKVTSKEPLDLNSCGETSKGGSSIEHDSIQKSFRTSITFDMGKIQKVNDQQKIGNAVLSKGQPYKPSVTSMTNHLHPEGHANIQRSSKEGSSQESSSITVTKTNINKSIVNSRQTTANQSLSDNIQNLQNQCSSMSSLASKISLLASKNVGNCANQMQECSLSNRNQFCSVSDEKENSPDELPSSEPASQQILKKSQISVTSFYTKKPVAQNQTLDKFFFQLKAPSKDDNCRKQKASFKSKIISQSNHTKQRTYSSEDIEQGVKNIVPRCQQVRGSVGTKRKRSQEDCYSMKKANMEVVESGGGYRNIDEEYSQHVLYSQQDPLVLEETSSSDDISSQESNVNISSSPVLLPSPGVSPTCEQDDVRSLCKAHHDHDETFKSTQKSPRSGSMDSKKSVRLSQQDNLSISLSLPSYQVPKESSQTHNQEKTTITKKDITAIKTPTTIKATTTKKITPDTLSSDSDDDGFCWFTSKSWKRR